MKSIFLFLTILSLFLLISSVSAEWFCEGEIFDDCDSSSPKECCVGPIGDDVAVCLSNDLSCESACCTSGACDNHNDFRFCQSGTVPNCDLDKKELNCCPQDFPSWNDQSQSCWKSNWECVDDTSCLGEEVCDSHVCRPPSSCDDLDQNNNIEIIVTGNAAGSGQIDFNMVSIPSGAEVFFILGNEFLPRGTTPYSTQISTSDFDIPLFHLEKEGFRAEDIIFGETNRGKFLEISVELIPDECVSLPECPGTVDYDSSIAVVDDCAVTQFYENFQSGCQWFFYRWQSPSGNTIIMTEAQFKLITPEECWAEPTECDSDSDCDSGFECTNNECVEIPVPDCTIDSDCLSGFICQNNVCIVDGNGNGNGDGDGFDFTIIGIVLIGGLVVFSVFRFNLLGKRRR